MVVVLKVWHALDGGGAVVFDEQTPREEHLVGKLMNAQHVCRDFLNLAIAVFNCIDMNELY